MDRAERKAAAEAILGIPLFNQLMDEMEASEVDQAVNAPYNDDKKRQAHLVAVKQIRVLRSKIGTLASEGQPSGGKKAPA